MTKKVSVILPTYNPNQKWLNEAIRSVLEQEYQNFELLVIDDGSEEEVETLINKEHRNDNRTQIIRQKNKGFSTATNRGIKESSGELIAPIGDDDIWKEEKLKRQIKEIEKGRDAIFSKAHTIDVEGCQKEVQGEFPKKEIPELFFRCFPCYESLLIRRDVFKNHGTLDENYQIAADWDFWMRVWDKIDIGYINETLVSKREHGDRLSKELELLTSEDVKALKKHIPRYNLPEETRKRIFSELYRKRGKRFYENEEKKRARKMWRKGLKTNPKDYKIGFLLTISFSNKLYYSFNRIYSFFN